MKLPPRIVVCPKCGRQFDADSHVVFFHLLGILLGFLLCLGLCHLFH